MDNLPIFLLSFPGVMILHVSELDSPSKPYIVFVLYQFLWRIRLKWLVAPTDSDAGLDSHRLREKGFHKRRDVEQAVKNAHCNRSLSLLCSSNTTWIAATWMISDFYWLLTICLLLLLLLSIWLNAFHGPCHLGLTAIQDVGMIISNLQKGNCAQRG